ncbi:LysE family translocator [Psychrobacter sp. WY6]|uniref:LysE family translocator n=1 Tax=Psychrobacter sp. WY6 TaxID=2708350 RepID=UPI002023081C|nr:LysE family translocator [Psychrobacter sp. WY6]
MNWDLLSIFITVGLAHFLALLSPGPDFVLIVKSAIKNDSKDAIGVALGITFANAVYIGLCLIGVGSILAASAPIMITLKIIGGLFLMYLGIQALRARKDAYDQFQVAQSPHSNIPKTTFLKEFTAGFLSGIFNPKNLLFYLSLFM